MDLGLAMLQRWWRRCICRSLVVAAAAGCARRVGPRRVARASLGRDPPRLVDEAALRPRGAARPLARGVRRGAVAAPGARRSARMARHRARHGADLRPLRHRALVQPAGSPARGPESARRPRAPRRARPPRQQLRHLAHHRLPALRAGALLVARPPDLAIAAGERERRPGFLRRLLRRQHLRLR
jgi:hypothetical protein